MEGGHFSSVDTCSVFSRRRHEHDYRELKDGLGLDHFEGRSYTGWHRHVTLATLAQAFCTQLRKDPKARAPG
jgi:SRSO17 transposase